MAPLSRLVSDSKKPASASAEAGSKSLILVRPRGFEPLTSSFGGKHSIQLSYGRGGIRILRRGPEG